MKKIYAYGWIPVTVEYTEDMPEGYGGYARCFPLPHIAIRPKYENDVGLHAHELDHAELMWLFGVVGFWVLYKVRRFRQYSEVRAYRRQIACYPAGTSIEFAVQALVKKYNLGLNEDEARKLLKTWA